MKTPLLSERISDLMREKIQNEFNSVLAEEDYQTTDGISLEPLTPESIRISTEVESLTMPTVYILDGPSEMIYDDDQNYMKAETEFVLAIASEEVGAEAMKRKAWRYQRVLWRLFNLAELKSGDARLMVRCFPVRYGTSTPSSSKSRLPGQEQKFRSDAILELRVRSFEKNEEP